jgi:hypothetical protein
MSSKFTHLHVHSHYSLLSALPKIDELIEKTKEKMSLTKLGKTKSKETKNRMSKSRSGEGGSNTKLNWDIVKKIRLDYNCRHLTQKQLAEKYEVTQTAISLIVNNKTWKI